MLIEEIEKQLRHSVGLLSEEPSFNLAKSFHFELPWRDYLVTVTYPIDPKQTDEDYLGRNLVIITYLDSQD